jgi:hypothetical protein
VPDHDPADPLGDPRETDTDAEHSSDETDPDPTHATMRERGPGGHEEQVGEEPTLRADDTAPGVDPDEGA